MKQIDWVGIKQGFRSLASRNAILIIIINITNQFTNYMRTSFRGMLGRDVLGLTPEIIGLCITLFTLVNLIMRAPAGTFTDSRRGKIKYVLSAAILCKAAVFACYGFISSIQAYLVLYILDGAIYAFITTMVPALLAISVDRRVMGSAYALYMGLMQVVIAPAESIGIGLYQSQGPQTTALITSAVSLITVAVALCLDSKQLCRIVDTSEEKALEASKRNGFFSAINPVLIPLAICTSIPIIASSMDNNFTQLYATQVGFNFLVALAAAQTIYGVINIFIGVLCDIFDPKILILLSLSGQTVGMLCMGSAPTSIMFCTGLFIFNIFRFYNTPFKVLGMKMVAYSAQGSFQATMLMLTDMITLCAVPLLSFTIKTGGYHMAYYVTGAVLLLDIFLFILLQKKGLIYTKNSTNIESH